MENPTSSAEQRLSVSHKFMLAIVLVGLGDWLFFGWNAGVSVVIFFLALVGCSILSNPVHVSAYRFYGACAVLGLSLLPMVEGMNVLSFLFGTAGSLFFVMVASGAWQRVGKSKGKLLALLVLVMPFRIIPDLLKDHEMARRHGKIRFNMKGAVGLSITLGFCALFIWLLSAANPLISGFFKGWVFEGNFPSMGRVLFWVFLLMGAWIFVGFSVLRYRKLWDASRGSAKVSQPLAETPSGEGILASAGALTLALVLFNLIFAVQTVSDALYLWGNAALPEGMTYATYAYRGTNALMAAAILAACFMLLAMRKRGEGESSFAVRLLLYIWIAQNIILVCSASLRLDLYVKVYSLTMWRMATFIWMGLVVAGFILIALRVLLRRSNDWLVLMNAGSAVLVLYICCFVNFPAAITNYNAAVAKSLPISIKRQYFASISTMPKALVCKLIRRLTVS